jgi:ribosome-associated heat shock protein Hsp15
MYQETDASIQQRKLAAEQHRLAPEPALSLGQGRPTKRDRRDGEKLRDTNWNERWSASID